MRTQKETWAVRTAAFVLVLVAAALIGMVVTVCAAWSTSVFTPEFPRAPQWLATKVPITAYYGLMAGATYAAWIMNESRRRVMIYVNMVLTALGGWTFGVLLIWFAMLIPGAPSDGPTLQLLGLFLGFSGMIIGLLLNYVLRRLKYHTSDDSAQRRA